MAKTKQDSARWHMHGQQTESLRRLPLRVRGEDQVLLPGGAAVKVRLGCQRSFNFPHVVIENSPTPC